MKKRLIALVLILLIACSGTSFAADTSVEKRSIPADEVMTSTIIEVNGDTNVSSGKLELNAGEKIKIKYEFSENSKYNFKKGDVIKIDFPKGTQVGFSANSSQIELMFNGEKVGTCVINRDSATITITGDNVEDLNDVKFGFSCYLTAYGDNFDSEGGNETIQCFGREIKISVSPTGVIGAFFSKVGDQITEGELRWCIYIDSRTRKIQNDFFVTDTLGEGQTIKAGSISFAIEEPNGQYHSLTEEELAKYVDLEMDNDKKGLKLHIKKELSEKFLQVLYTTDLLDDKAKYSNTVVADSYQIIENGIKGPVVNNEKFFVEADNYKGNAWFDGKYQKGDILVTNEIRGNAASKDDVFTFSVKFKDSNDNLIPENKQFTYVKKGTNIEGKINSNFSLKLKGGEAIIIKGLPVETQYEIIETDDKGYTSSAEGNKGKISLDKKHAITFVNKKK